MLSILRLIVLTQLLQHIKLVFTRFNVEDGPTGCFDYLAISSPLSDGTTTSHTLCGNQLPQDIFINNNIVSL